MTGHQQNSHRGFFSKAKIQADVYKASILSSSDVPAWSEGLMFYDDESKSLSYYNDQSDVTVNIGKELVEHIKNTQGSAITDGQAVYTSGSSGDNPEVKLAKSNALSTLEGIFIVTQTSINNNAVGVATSYGKVRGLDTSDFSDGDALYVDATTAGDLTNTKPIHPNHVLHVGYCIRSHEDEGVIFVHPKLEPDIFLSGSVIFANGSGEFDENNPLLNWLDSTARLNVASERIGNSTSYTDFNSTGDLSLVGDAIAWDDIRVPLSSIKRLGFTDPDWVQFQDDGSGSTGVYVLAFDKDTDEEIFFDVQLPHNWKLGTDLHPHVHWSPSNTNTGDVTWKLEYTIAAPGATFGNTVFLSGTQAGGGTALNHQAIDLGDIDMSAYVNATDISIMLVCRLFRDISDADDYNADAFLLEIDFHYQLDTLGSNEELTK